MQLRSGAFAFFVIAGVIVGGIVVFLQWQTRADWEAILFAATTAVAGSAFSAAFDHNFENKEKGNWWAPFQLPALMIAIAALNAHVFQTSINNQNWMWIFALLVLYLFTYFVLLNFLNERRSAKAE